MEMHSPNIAYNGREVPEYMTGVAIELFINAQRSISVFRKLGFEH
jgi:hypothetical protein